MAHPTVIIEEVESEATRSNKPGSGSGSYRDSFQSSNSQNRRGSGSHRRSQSEHKKIPISNPGEERKQLVSEEEDAYKSKASGMGQTRGMSVFSGDGAQEVEVSFTRD